MRVAARIHYVGGKNAHSSKTRVFATISSLYQHDLGEAELKILNIYVCGIPSRVCPLCVLVMVEGFAELWRQKQSTVEEAEAGVTDPMLARGVVARSLARPPCLNL